MQVPSIFPSKVTPASYNGMAVLSQISNISIRGKANSTNQKHESIMKQKSSLRVRQINIIMGILRVRNIRVHKLGGLGTANGPIYDRGA